MHGNLRASIVYVCLIPAGASEVADRSTRALGPIRLTVLLSASIDGGGKVVQLGRRIRTNRFCALLPIRRTYFPMFILLPFSTKIIGPMGG